MRRLMCSFGLFAAILMAFAAPTFTATPADAASTGCLPGLLKQRLAQIRKKFGSVRIVSTHRRGARIAGTGKRSLHASCRAVDFHPPRGKHRSVVAWLKSNHGGGVGTYSCGMHHIHLDNGPRVRFHHCVSASGRPVRRYAKSRRNRSAKSRVASRTSQTRRRTVRRRVAAKRTAARSKAPSTQRSSNRVPVQRRATAPRTAVAANTSNSFGALRHFTSSKINGR